MRRVWFSLVLFLIISTNNGNAVDSNDLWQLINSYEDVGITPKDLAIFLQSHGYDATVSQSCVTVRLADIIAYLTPNGAATGLAYMWKKAPFEKSPTPYLVISPDAIKKNVTLNKSENTEQFNELSKIAVFPVKPLGMCLEGAEQLEKLYVQSGYKSIYLYNAQSAESQGHLWVAIQDLKQTNSWIAVDSYFGVITDNTYYYEANYSFSDIKYLYTIIPHWNTA